MKRILGLLLFVVFSVHGQDKSNLIIDRSLIKKTDLLWDLAQLSQTPEVKWLDKKSKVNALLFKSVDYKGKPSQVFAYYSNPDLLMGKPAGKRKFPGVVLIHGGGGTAFKVWVEKWAAEGYAAIAMDLSGKDGDGKKLANPGPDQFDEDKFNKIDTADLKDMWTYQAVASSILAHSLLLRLPEVDTKKTAVTGISWGGYLTCLVASLDNRFKAAVPVYGCGFYDESDVFKVPLQQMSRENHAKWMRYFDPSAYLSEAQPKFCFLNGNKDKFYNVEPYHKTYSLVPEKQRTVLLLPDMKHSHDWGWEPHEIRYFFESIINDRATLTKVGKVMQNDRELYTTFETPVSVWQADFYYSTDTTFTNENRAWQKQPVTIDHEKRTLSTNLPQGGFKYGFFALKDHRNVSASSEFIIGSQTN